MIAILYMTKVCVDNDERALFLLCPMNDYAAHEPIDVSLPVITPERCKISVGLLVNIYILIRKIIVYSPATPYYLPQCA